jgi:hypothetical protein
MEKLLNAVKNLYIRNRQSPLRFRRNDHVIMRLFHETKKNVPQQSQFFVFVYQLARYNNSRNVSFSRNNNFIISLYREGVKLSQELSANKIEPLVKPENIKEPSSDKKAALLIGINYKGTNAELRGCENDIKNTKNMLISKYGFQEKDIVILMESSGMRNQPTRANILRYVRWLVNKSNSGYGSVWFQYSGHGTYIDDRNRDEKDGKDECIYTCDEKLIVDDEFHRELVSNIHAKSKLFCFMDCCHSGTIMDLKYKYKTSNNCSQEEHSSKAASANVIALSGCRDAQTSADAWLSGSWCGALTKTFLDVMRQSNYNISLFEMVNKIRLQLQRDKFTQVPQLTSSKQLSSNSKFVL